MQETTSKAHHTTGSTESKTRMSLKTFPLCKLLPVFVPNCFSAWRLATSLLGFGSLGENHSLKQSSVSGTTLKLLFHTPSQKPSALPYIVSNILQGFPTGHVLVPLEIQQKHNSGNQYCSLSVLGDFTIRTTVFAS